MMTDHELEGRIRTAMEHAAPDKLEHILSSCGTQKGTVISMSGNDFNKKKKRWTLPLAAAAALVLICGSAFGFQSWQTSHTVDSIVMLDVNPSLSLTVNTQEKVLSVDALNEDAQIVLGDMDLKGTDLDVAVNALIGSMLRNGYLSDLQNSILVTVENDDAARSAQLQDRIASTIDAVFAGGSLDGAVLSQSVSTSDEQLTQLASDYGISLGKAALIQSIVTQDPTLTFASLAPLSVNEISLIASSRGLSSDTVTQTGTASVKAYIGEDAAKTAAFTHAGVSSNEVSFLKIEFDSDNGVIVYELEFYVNNVEYDYDINALTGEVVKYSREDHGVSSVGTSSGTYIGESAAKAAALAHAGVSESSTTYLNCWISYDDGRAEYYEVEFMVGQTRYEYEISLTTGAVIKSEQETFSKAPSSSSSSGTSSSSTSSITEAEAKAAAFAHAGVSESAASSVKVKLDYDDGWAVYDVEFRVDATEYEYEILASNGTILKSERDIDDDYIAASSAAGTSTYIGESAAKSAAFTHAGVAESAASAVKVKLDYDDGQAVYDVEFRVGATEYEYELLASDGTILKSERDTDDDYVAPSTSTNTNTNTSTSNTTNNTTTNTNTGTGSTTYIGESAAKTAAFTHAGVSSSDVYGLEIKLDYDDGKAVYELEFQAGQMEYEYEIDAITGSVLKYEQDRDD